MSKRLYWHWQKRFMPPLLFCLFTAGAFCGYWQLWHILSGLTPETVIMAEFAILLLLLVGCGSPVQLAMIPCLCFIAGVLTAVWFLASGLPELDMASGSILWAVAYVPVFLSCALACMRAALNTWYGWRGYCQNPAPFFWFGLALTLCGLVLLLLVKHFFMFR